MPSKPDVLDFERRRMRCIVNLSADDLRLDDGCEVLLASAELTGTSLPPDTTIWATRR